MPSLLSVIQRYDSEDRLADVAIVGTAKNVGKTTTLNWLIEHLASGATLALTSVGRDGEDLDSLTALPKPRIAPPVGTLVATSDTAVRRSRGQLSLLAETPFRTALGRVGIYRMVDTGPVELVGPVSAADAAILRVLLRQAGARRVLVDGAIDRKASAAPEVADIVMLATGMAMLDCGGGRQAPDESRRRFAARQVAIESSNRIDAVANRTHLMVRMLGLEARDQVSPRPTRTGCTCTDGRFVPYDGPSSLDHAEEFIRWIPADAIEIAVVGAFTEPLAAGLFKSPKKGMGLVLPNGTHLLCSPESFDRLAARGWVFRASDKIRIAAVTSNPTSPHLTGVDPQQLVSALRAALNLPVYDLMAPERARQDD